MQYVGVCNIWGGDSLTVCSGIFMRTLLMQTRTRVVFEVLTILRRIMGTCVGRSKNQLNYVSRYLWECAE